MNIMSINNTSFEGKAPKFGVNWARTINNLEYHADVTLRDKIKAIEPELKEAANTIKRNITLAQRKNSLLVNSGAVTTLIKDIENKSAEQLYNEISNNISAGRRASRGEALSNILG